MKNLKDKIPLSGRFYTVPDARKLEYIEANLDYKKLGEYKYDTI